MPSAGPQEGAIALAETLRALTTGFAADMGIVGLPHADHPRPGVAVGLDHLADAMPALVLRALPPPPPPPPNGGEASAEIRIGLAGIPLPPPLAHALWLWLADTANAGALVLLRTIHAAPFTAADRRRLAALVPFLAPGLAGLLAVTLRQEDDHHGQKATALAFDALAGGMVITDAQGRVVQANAAARALIARRAGLEMAGPMLTATDPAAAGRLAALIGDAARCVRHGDLWPGAAVPLPAPRDGADDGVRDGELVGAVVAPLGGAPPLVLLHLVAARPGSRPMDAEPPAAQDGGPRWGTPLNVLRGLFGLTAAEAALLHGLLLDKRLEDYAGERGVAVTTVRTQLAALFRKTRTSRQAELVRLAHSAIGPLRLG